MHTHQHAYSFKVTDSKNHMEGMGSHFDKTIFPL